LAASFAWGFLAAVPLIVGGAVALQYRVGERTLGLVMAFGSGVLISAVAFELVQEAWDKEGAHAGVGLGLFAGSLTFWAGDALITRGGGGDRKHSGGRQAEGSPLAIVLGTILDGVPESIVLGLNLVIEGTVSAAFLVAVALSNIPEALAATTGLVQAGWKRMHILALWLGVALTLGLAALAGYALLDTASNGVVAFVLSFAGGAILTMLADTMMPEAFEHGGNLVGVVTTCGFALAFAVSAFG
jgi:ZIP family zinc transporter